MKEKNFYALVIAIALLLSCSSSKTEDDNSTLGSYPDEIIRFHISNSGQGYLFVFTNYFAPYSGSYRVITLTTSGKLVSYLYKPNFSYSGTIRGEFNESELVEVKENLYRISHTNVGNSFYGDQNFTVTILTPSPIVISCNETSCPKEFCYFYELINSVVRKENPSYTGEAFACPITGQ